MVTVAKKAEATNLKEYVELTISRGIAFVQSQKTKAVSPFQNLFFISTFFLLVCYGLTKLLLFAIAWIVIAFIILVVYIILIFKKPELLMTEEYNVTMAKLYYGDSDKGLSEEEPKQYLESEAPTLGIEGEIK